jgi:hypothetical protein
LEVRGIKKDQFWKTDSQGMLKLHEVGQDICADLSSDYKLHRTLQRRGVAMHMAHLLSFKHHDALVRWYMRELHREPVPGYRQVTIDQVHNADQEVFLRLAEETRSGLLLNPVTGDFPLDAILPQVMLETRITSFLNPLPLSSKVPSDNAGAKRAADKEVERLRQENQALKDKMRNVTRTGKASGKGGGKEGSKGTMNQKAPKSGQRMPKELIGLPARVDGVNCCYAFNLKGCSEALDGNGACSKGKHACLRCGSTGHGASSSRCTKR